MKELLSLAKAAAKSGKVWSTAWLWMAILALFGVETADPATQDVLLVNMVAAIVWYASYHPEYVQNNDNDKQ